MEAFFAVRQGPSCRKQRPDSRTIVIFREEIDLQPFNCIQRIVLFSREVRDKTANDESRIFFPSKTAQLCQNNEFCDTHRGCCSQQHKLRIKFKLLNQLKLLPSSFCMATRKTMIFWRMRVVLFFSASKTSKHDQETFPVSHNRLSFVAHRYIALETQRDL